jgi:hypothetical protein
MRATAWKWIKRMGWVLPALLIVYLSAKLVDFGWYRTQIPVGFFDAKWSGFWETEFYGGWTGRLLVKLPDPLPENKDFQAEALVYYPVYSTYKTGQFVKMDFTGHFSPDTPMSTGQSANEIPGVGGKLKFKGVIGNQVVEYVALLDPTRTRIVGGYLSSSPYDYGHFSIHYY